MKDLYLIRGLPGSGKSAFAKELMWRLNAFHYEADMYMNNEAGEYEWSPDKVHMAHQWCQRHAAQIMADGQGKVVVSNTFTTEKELKPYLDLAEKYGYRVTTLIVENRHGNSSIHDVPEETMLKMKNRFSIKL